MYIAGRLRTASIPPRTLIEVASYLCPPGLFAAGVSLSPMSRTSPQMLFGRLPKIRLTASGKACRAESARRLPCPLAPFLETLAELGLEGFFSAPSRPHHADVAEPSFPPLRGLCGASLASLALARAA